MTDNKVVLPQSVSNAIEHLRKVDWSDESLLDLKKIEVYASEPTHSILDFVRVNGKTPYFSAIINGYVVELKPEELIKRVFDQKKNHNPNLYTEGMLFVLDTLKIKIEGVNK